MSGNVGTTEDKQWLDVVMPKIAESIGERGTTRYVLSSIKQRLISDIYFVYMSCTNEINQLGETRMLVIKRTNKCKLTEVKYQFHNEIVFYQMFYQSGENFPRYFYGYDASLDSSEYSIIVLEDVSRNGFKESPASFDVPYSYILAVMRELGRFHAKGYILKETNRTKFQSIVDKIQETRFYEKTNMRPFLNITSTRVVDYLRAQNHDTSFCDKLEALLSNVFDKVIIPIITVTESSELLSTICHGDVTLDNMLFQPLSGERFNGMLIDFGMMRYSTPVVDLSTFFCLCCTNDMVRNKLHDMLAVYHTALTDYMSLGGVKDTQKYSYKAILNNYKEGCLYGFVLASFYLVCLLGYVDPVETEERYSDMEMLAKEYNKSGGDQVSATLAEMLLQMVEMGSLDHFL